MAVLQAGKALVSRRPAGAPGSICPHAARLLTASVPQGGADGEDDEEEELGDEAMMALDENLASLFAEQKLRIQARRDEKNKLQKEKVLRRDFQIRVSLQLPTGPPWSSGLVAPPLLPSPHLAEPTHCGRRSWT